MLDKLKNSFFLALNIINWRFLIIEALIIYSTLLIGKLSASYEGCLILYNPNRWMLGFALVIPLGILWLLKDNFIVKENKDA